MSNAPPAFREGLVQALPRIARYARSLTFDEVDAQDLTQLTVERALQRWHQYDSSRELAVWLLAIAHNAFLDGTRRSARTVVTDPSELTQLQDNAGGSLGTDVGLRLDLVAALDRISPDQREALLLVCVEQLSYAEVAQVLSIPMGTVMSRVCRGRQSLRQFLEAAGEGSSGRAGGPAGSATLRRVV